ncbi:uncharacterized protein LOC105831797 isoform X1 [Monomorium pharaonis]|uniref:uncharacterized protein LOC105831797 isoform X1 n=1 Tax=Monomorium pharaonis TaxID=307658 RepID=UPI001746F05D|nr:uncharacterized protein LOC105831797 isoform X1 [Monomorium pharaonis]
MEEIRMPVHNLPSIEHTLRPISYTSWFMGVGIAHPLKCPKFVTIIIRIIHLVICTMILTRSIYKTGLDFSMDSVIRIGWLIERMIYFVATYYYIYHGIRQYNTWPELMDKIKELDRKIRKKTHMNDEPVKVMEAVAILMTFVCFPLIPIVLYLYDFLTSNYVAIESRPFSYMMAQSTINSFFFGVVVYVLYYRYKMINKMLGHLDELSDETLISHKIRRIRELHNGKLCRILLVVLKLDNVSSCGAKCSFIESTNIVVILRCDLEFCYADIYDLAIVISNIHGLYLLLFSVNCFSIVTTTLYFGYVYFINSTYVRALIYYMISVVYTIQFGVICWVCKLAGQEFEKTKTIMCAIALKYQSTKFDKPNDIRNQLSLEVRPPLEDADSEQNFNGSNSGDWNYVVMENLLRKILARDHVSNEINAFFIQLQHRRVSFTACDFFEMNNNLFCGFLGVIFTYLIIFIQFGL